MPQSFWSMAPLRVRVGSWLLGAGFVLCSSASDRRSYLSMSFGVLGQFIIREMNNAHLHAVEAQRRARLSQKPHKRRQQSVQGNKA